MVSKRKASRPQENTKLLRALLIVAILTTLAISPKAINAFNSIKLIVLMLLTAVTLGWLSLNSKKYPLRIDKSLIIISISFIVALLLNIVLGSMPVRHALVGLFGRNNGALTYICLLILLILASTISHLRAAGKFLFSLSWLGTLLSIYGLMQDSGFDFIDYGDTTFPNPIFLTLGNTNFTSALIGMSLMATVSILFFRDIKVFNKLVLKILTFLSIALQGMVLYRAEATQGFIALGAGIAVFFLLLPAKSQKNTIQIVIGKSRRVFGVFVLIIACLGVFGIGPLSILFSSGARSLEDRYYHWVAGFSMFKDNLMFGVGLDSFGQWFRAYRTPESIEFLQTAKGFANDAHNVYVQIAATGGLALLIPFLLINFLVLFKALGHLLTSKFSREFLGLLSVWIVFQAQIFVSINQTAIAVWGWIVGGLIINCAKWDLKPVGTETEPVKRKILGATLGSQVEVNKGYFLAFPIACTLFLCAFFFNIPSHVAEYQIKDQIIKLDQALTNPNPEAKEIVQASSQRLLNLGKKTPDPFLRYACIEQLLIGGFTEEALEIANLTAQQYPREFDAWDAIGFIYENTGRAELAIEARKIQFTLDPLNPILRERFAP